MTKTPIIVDDAVLHAETGTDNLVLPFRLENADIRGRAVRLGTVADQVLAAHSYPPPVAGLVGELLALTALLGSMFKFDGTLTIQAKGKGPVSLLVADCDMHELTGTLRGYAQFSAEAIARSIEDDATDPEALLGGGNLIMTIDPADPDMERYQGIVELAGDSLSACARGYFRSSEQLPTEVLLAASPHPVLGHWRAGGIIIQHLGRAEVSGERLHAADNDGDREAWRRATILLETVKVEELVDATLELPELLYRLFHEDGVRVFDPVRLTRGCRCSREKIAGVLARFPETERRDMANDGTITVTCEFCNRSYSFDLAAE